LQIPRAIRRSVARKLLLAVGIPTTVLAAAGLLWLRAETRAFAPGMWRAVAAGALLVGAGMVVVHFVAVRLIVKQPLRALARAVRGARAGDGLVRVPVRGEDEIAQLADSFNGSLQAITDLLVQRTDDALALAAMQREVRLNAQLEEQARLLDRANRELEGRLRELEILGGLSHKLNATLDLKALCDVVADAVAQQLGFDGFALLVTDAAKGDLVVRAALGVEARAVGARLALGDGAAGLAARERELVVVADVHSDPRTSVRTWLPAGAGSLLAAPMVHLGECVGVLDFWRPLPGAFTAEDIRFLASVADQAAMAIANARLHEETVALSLTDPLTGVLNRRGLSQRLQLEIDRAEPFGTAFSVGIVDVDRLKAILQGHGLVAGDAALRELARVVAAQLRKVDVLARYRGDKFTVILPGSDQGAALDAAERIRRAVEAAAFEHAGRPGAVTVSVGVATFPDDGRELEALVDAADAALFAAKAAGRNAVRAFSAGMREDPQRPRKGRLTAALEPEA
jgi:diguanylate cyclase (GGDEF)-like protein